MCRDVPEQAEAPAGSVSRDNRELNDAGAVNQQLTTEQIAELRGSGQDGAAIVAALASNSATYASKTEFSQEKYRKRKSRKYCIQATLVQPTARSICEVMTSPSCGGFRMLHDDRLCLWNSGEDVTRSFIWSPFSNSGSLSLTTAVALQ